MTHHKKLGVKHGLFSVLLTTLLASATTTALAEGNVENGKKLFDKSQCQKCHGTEVFTREDHTVKDIAGLSKQVRMCDSQLSVNWFDDEIADVVAYLNDAFYKFETSDKTGEKKKTKK